MLSLSKHLLFNSEIKQIFGGVYPELDEGPQNDIQGHWRVESNHFVGEHEVYEDK